MDLTASDHLNDPVPLLPLRAPGPPNISTERPALAGRKLRRMSAQPDLPGDFIDATIRARIRAGVTRCDLIESLAVAGRLDLARKSMDEVNAILEDVDRFTSDCKPSVAAKLAPDLDDLRHRARNAETVLKLVE
jgi:hypothetical protein